MRSEKGEDTLSLAKPFERYIRQDGTKAPSSVGHKGVWYLLSSQLPPYQQFWLTKGVFDITFL
jgi:hypothetical protein